jgi:hypothetical protein
MRNTVTNSDDIIDSLDIELRIDEIETEYTSDDGEFSPDMIPDDERDEYDALTAFRDDMSGYVWDWNHGEILIRDDHFETYAQELAQDIGVISSNASWPLNHIDWKAAAVALQEDYHSGEFDGVTYWGRR